MKIYFLGAVSGLDKYADQFHKIVDTLENPGHKVLSDHIFVEPQKVQHLDQDKRRGYFRKMQGRIKSSDVVVADVSKPTANIGYEIAYALEREKPVLVLRYEKSVDKLSALFEGNTSDKFIAREYNDGNLADIIDNSLEELKSMLDVRYNFFISREIVDYLNFVSKSRRLPRSVFLRDLVEREMEVDEDYQTYITNEEKKNALD